MARGNGIRGSRIGAAPSNESVRGIPAERVVVTFWCAEGHPTRPTFASTAETPRTWDCHECGLLAGPDRDNPPAVTVLAPFRRHLSCVRQRRTDAEAEVILSEALAKLRAAA